MIKTDNLIKIGLNIYAIYTSGVIFSRNWVIVFTKRKDKAAADTIIFAISASLKEADIAAPHVFKKKIGRKKRRGKISAFFTLYIPKWNSNKGKFCPLPARSSRRCPHRSWDRPSCLRCPNRNFYISSCFSSFLQYAHNLRVYTKSGKD